METLAIKNTDQLIDAINVCQTGLFEYRDVIHSIDFGFEDVENLAQWDTENFNRITVAHTDRYDLQLCCWEKGHQALIEATSHEQIWVYVLKGFFGVNDGKTIKQLGEGDWMHTHGELERLEFVNMSNRSATLHLTIRN